MSPLNMSENKAYAPDNSNNNICSRSKKCLNLALKSSENSTPSKSVPLSELSNIPFGVSTPTKPVPLLDADSPGALFLSSSSPGQEFVCSPITRPKTPRSELKRNFEVPVLKSAAIGFVSQTKSTKNITSPELSVTKTSPIPRIVTTSFYSNLLTPKSDTTALSACVVRSQPPPRRASAGGSLSRHRSRSSGGNKRKRVGRSGVGHNIKKPKFRHHAESSKQGKDSIQHNLANENQKQSSRSFSSKASPTSGLLSLTNQTKIQFEVKGGQIVYRSKAKTVTTPKTPLRRSPRKIMSPLKADYFSSSVKERGKGKGGKLFSPNTNFFTPDEFSPLKGSLPSPVKFSNSVTIKEGDHNLSELITSLAKDKLGEFDEEVSKPPDHKVPGVTPQSRDVPSKFSSSTNNMPDVSKAITNILNDLSSGDDSISDMEGNSTASSVETPPVESSSSKLYSIFYKNSAYQGDDKLRSEKGLSIDKKFLCSSLSDNQTIIDAGQKTIGATLCPTCGSVYTVGDPQDEKQHSLQHSVLMDKLKLTGWKTERVVGQFTGGRVLCVKPGDHPMHWKKVEEVLAVVDSDLGFSEVGIRWPDKSKAFLYVVGKKIVGFLLAECIGEAFPIIPNEGADLIGKVYYCSEVVQPVKCGISRIWVLADHRRSKVASSLVDCMRSSFIQNHYLNKTEFAFSDPTLNGIKFASSYMKSARFLVYNR